ncbi:MAG: hypothetical protein ACR2PY_05075 [Salinispira sp.]
MSDINEQTRKNVDAYKKAEDNLIQDHYGKYAVFSNGNLEGIYNDLDDAYKIGLQLYGDGKFTIRQIGQKPINLGFMSTLIDPIPI